MAGNNSIQILRAANLASSANRTQVPLAGQPLYDQTTRKLFVGDGTTQAQDLSPITAGNLNSNTAYVNTCSAYMNGYTFDINGSNYVALRSPGSGAIPYINVASGSGITMSAFNRSININASALNINSGGSLNTTSRGLNVVSELDASIDITRDFDMHSGYNIDVDADNNINMNALAFNANAATNANYFASLSLSNQGININANMQGNGKVDIYGSAGIKLRTGLVCNVNIGTMFEVNGSSKFTGTGTTTIVTPYTNISSSSVDIYGGTGINIRTSQASINVAQTIAINSPNYGVSINGLSTTITGTRSANLCLDSSNYIRLAQSGFGGSAMKIGGAAINFPSSAGTLALTSQAWVPTYWTAQNRTWIEIDASTSCAAYNGFYYEQPGSEQRFAINGRLFGKDEGFFLSSTANLSAAYNNMAYGFVVAKITMNAVAYNAGNVGQVHTISTGNIPIFFHPAQIISTQYYGAAQTFNPNSTAWNASQSYSSVVEYVPYIDVRMQGGELLLVPKISYLHGPTRVLNVIVDSVINCTLSGGYIMTRADK